MLSRNLVLSVILLSFLIPLSMFNFPTAKATSTSSAPCPQSSIDSICQFNYPDFSSTTGLDLNGNAQQASGSLRLTSTTPNSQRGSAWYDIKQDVSEGFRTIFHFQITNAGADGFAFVIQNSNVSALGDAGDGLGYQGITRSLAVEFDTFQNTFFLGNLGDISDHEIAVHSNGAAANSANELSALSPGPIISPVGFQKDQLVHTVKIIYNLGVFEVFLDDFSNPVLSLAVNLGTELGLSNGTTYVGFTGATGGQTENNDILDWIFYTQTPSSNIVENGNFSNNLLGWTSVSSTRVRGARGEFPIFQSVTEMPAPSQCTPYGRRGTSFLAIDAAFGASGYVEQQVTIPSSGELLTLTSWGWEDSNPQLGISGITNANVSIVDLGGTQHILDSFTPLPMLIIIDPSNPAAFTCTGNSPVSKSYDLSAFAGQTVKLRLGSQSNNCCGTLTAFADVDIEAPGVAVFHCPPLAGYRADTNSCALPNASPGQPYAYNLQVTGGIPPYDFSSVSGKLPTGLVLGSNGDIHGTATSTGVFRENLVIQDQGTTPPVPVSITITVPPIVTGVSPAAGPVTGGTSLNITGIGFSEASSVSFNPTTANGYQIQSDNVIHIGSTPESCGDFFFVCLRYAPGIDNVSVTVNNHQSGFWCPDNGCNQFMYIQQDVQSCSSSAPGGLLALPGFTADNIRFHASRDVSIAVADAELSGSVAISPHAGYCIHTVGGQLKSFNFTTVVDTAASLFANVSLTAHYDNTGKPYVIAGPFPQAPMVAGPIIIVPTITPVLYVNASLSGAISGGISLNSEKTFGMTYNATTSKWTVTADALTCKVDPVSGKMATIGTLCVQPAPIEMTVQGSVKLAIGVQFSFLFYDIAGPVITPDVYLRLDAGYSTTPTSSGLSCDGLPEGSQAIPWAALCGGAEVRVGVQLNPWLDFLLPTTNWELPPFPIKSVLLASTVSATPTDPSATLQPDGTFKLSSGASTGISVTVAGSYLPGSLSASSSWNLSSFSQTCGSLNRLAPGTFSFTAPNFGEICVVKFTKDFLGLNIWTNSLSFQIPPVPPLPPSNPTASSQPGSLLIQWDAPSSNGGSAVSGYKLYRGTTPGSESLFASVGVASSFSDSSVACQTNYFYKVSALNSAGESSQSVEVNAASTCAPPSPLGLSGTSTTDSITLNWESPASDGGSPITGYIIYRGTSSAEESILVRVGVSTSYTDTSVTSGTTYYYKVAAVNTVGTSGESQELSSTTLSPTQPTGSPGRNSGGGTSPDVLYLIIGLLGGALIALTAGVVFLRKKLKQ